MIEMLSLAPACMNLVNGFVNRNAQNNFLKQQQRIQSELSEKQLELQRELAQKQEQTQLKLEFLKIHAQAEQERERQAFQEKLVHLNYQHDREIVEFIKSVDLAISEQNLNFQHWHLEQEKALQKQLADYNRETQILIAKYQRETALQLPEVHKIFENYPLRIVPAYILQSHYNEQIIPLKIIIAPPEVDFDKFSNGFQSSPKISKSLAEGLRQFLSKNYPLSDKTRPTEFLDGAWDSKRFHGGASIKILFEMLKSEPVLILESEVEGDYLNFRVAYWGLGQTSYTYESVISKLPYKEILYKSAKNRARQWRDTKNKLLQLGKSIEEIKRLGGDNFINLSILEESEELEKAGINLNNLPLEYKVNTKDCEELYKFLINYHCLIAGWFTDIYYLTHYHETPLLPQLLYEIIQEFNEPSIIETIVSGYREIYKLFEDEQPAWIPEMSLQLANSLVDLPDKSWAKEQIQYWMRSWLKLRGKESLDEWNDLIESVKATITLENREYIERLNQSLIKINEKKHIKFWLDEFALNKSIKTNYVFISVAIAPTSQTIISTSRIKIKLWSLNTAQEIFSFATSHNSGIITFAISPNEQDIAISESSEIILRSFSTLEKKAVFSKHFGTVSCLAFSPNSKYLISGSSDKTLKILDIYTGQTISTLRGHSEGVSSVAISPDGQYIVSGSFDKTIRVWRFSTGQEICTSDKYDKGVLAVAIHPDNRYIVFGTDETINIWDMNTNSEVHTLKSYSGRTVALELSPNGKYIFCGCADGTIKVFNFASGKKIITLKNHSGAITSLAISPDGKTLVSASSDKTINIWCVPSEEDKQNQNELYFINSNQQEKTAICE